MMTCKSTGLLAANGVIAARPCMIHGITLLQAAAASTAIIYDNATTNSGTEVIEAAQNANTNTSTGPQLPYPIECLNGAYLALTGTGAKAIVYYSLL